MDFPDLELFHGVGRGGHRDHQPPVITRVMGVNVLQVVHEIRHQMGHPGAPLDSSFPGVPGGIRSVQPRGTVAAPGTKSSEKSFKRMVNPNTVFLDDHAIL
jgi:hypothetical protein